MAAKLKVYATRIGFHDVVVAAPNQKAALAAWDVRENLFAQGAAAPTEDPEAVKAALAQPGVVLTRPAGAASGAYTAEKQTPPPPLPTGPRRARAELKSKDRTAKPKPAPPPAPPKPPPDRRALTAAEGELRALETERREAIDAIEKERRALDARETSVRRDFDARRRKLERDRDKARRAYEAAGGS